MVKCISCNDKQPSFNYKGEKKPIYCGGCKFIEMINVKDKKCLGCNDKQPSFNYKDEKAKFCVDCKLENMIDVLHKKCLVCNITIPNFNYKDEKKATHCGDCKLDGMIDIKNKKCILCNSTSANFNYKGEKKATHCGDCKLDNMIDIKHKKCLVCKITQPTFNYKDKKKATHCFDCKLENMVNVKHKKCIVCDNTRANFNYKDEKKPTHCGICKLKNMIDITHKKCNTCNFNRQNPRFKPICATCYRFNNPNSDFTRNYKIKENTIMKFVKDKYTNCVMDSTISGGCSKRRPDGLIEYDLFSIIIEIDEESHRNYDDICENKRLMEIYQDLNFKPLRLIRFNPDSYKDVNGKRVDSIFSLDSDNKLKVRTKKELNQRVNVLLATIEKVLENMNKEIMIGVNNIKGVDVEYLFFNENE